MTTLQDHPIAALFPLMGDEDAAALAESIKRNGFDASHPIVLFEGKILDGRNRYRAARAAGVEPATMHWTGDNPWAWVWRENAVRRHLEAGQKVALKLKFLRGSEQWADEQQRRRQAAEEVRRESIAEAAKARQRDTVGRLMPSASTAKGEQPDAVQRCTASGLEAPKPREPKRERDIVAAEAGVSPRTAASALELEKKAPELFEKVAAGELTLPKALGEVKQREKHALADELRSKPLPLPSQGPFDVLVVDPPWRYEARAEDHTHRGRNPYPDMSIEEICALPVGKLACENAVLWLWTTNAFMRQAYQCLDAWGFRERTILTWVKDRMGTGDWLRGKTEHAILAVKGKPIVTLTNQTTALQASLREHSRKPDEFYAMVDALCPGTKVELFAREGRAGWARWGAEQEKFDAK